MDAGNKVARIVGVLFLTAMVTSLVGGVWLDSMLSTPDYLAMVSTNETQVMVGVLLELVNCAAVVGIAALMFPILKRHNQALAVGYVGFRVVEAAMLVVAAVSPLVLVTLGQACSAGGAPGAASCQTVGTAVLAGRAHLAGLPLVVFFSLGALLLYSALYRSQLVPRFISVWGFIAVASVFTWNFLEAFDLSVGAGMVFVLPIILNEVFLGIWLIVKGFDASAIASESAQ